MTNDQRPPLSSRVSSAAIALPAPASFLAGGVRLDVITAAESDLRWYEWIQKNRREAAAFREKVRVLVLIGAIVAATALGVLWIITAV